MFELQDEYMELRDIWVQASNTAYLVDYVTDFCLSSVDIPIWSNLMHLSNAIEKIQSIKIEVSKIRQNDQIYNNIKSAKLNSQPVLPAGQGAYDATIWDNFKVGFEKEEQRLIDFLVLRKAACNVVAVYGMGGQGKTHLAQRVFHDERIKDHFYKRAWCRISQSYDKKKVLRKILKGVGEIVSTERTQEDLANDLRKCLMGQKYLVVLDDIWDVKAWFDFQESFPDVDGSRILLTSRNLYVASEVDANCSIVELNPLSTEESWNFLQMKVFHGDYCPPNLSEIGKTVAENCKGLPLAIVLVAGLLKENKDVESWGQICESLKPLLASEGCMDIVELSYKHLPDYLKPCFLYLGAFQEGEIIEAKQLIQFWIAEGFAQSNGIKTREVVANEYLMDLASRSLILVAQRSSRNGIKKCSVHDLLHQLCQIKVEEERFLLVLNDALDESSLNDDYFRIIGHDERWTTVLFYFLQRWWPFVDSKPFLRGLQSLLVSARFGNNSYIPVFLKTFKLLRVLNLAISCVSKTNFDMITQLIHLRLLAVGIANFAIPPSIVNLLKLEVLRVHPGRGFSTIFLPSFVINMPSLRHIFTSCGHIDYVECYDKLVPEMSSPSTNLETLTKIYFFDDEISFERVAQRFPNILKFGLICSSYFRLSSYFKRLESLKLNIQTSRRRDEIISPSTLDIPLTLKKLNLTVTSRLSGAMISSNGKLSYLEVLKLDANFENDGWDVEDDEFLKLNYLNFKSSSVQEWNLSDASFPCLEQVIVKYCFKLGELPDRFSSVYTLRRIEVLDCSESLKNSFQQIVDDQMDAGNEGLQHSMILSDVHSSGGMDGS